MPTGYTAYIEDGEITTGKEFLKLCTRAFGVAMELRDEPLTIPTPKHFEPNQYYKNRYDAAIVELYKVKSLSFDDVKQQMITEHGKKILDYKSIADNLSSKNETYSKIRSEVENWNPPTDEHKGIKRFALEQIDISMIDQKYIDEYREKSEEQLDISDDVVHEYTLEMIESKQKDVDYYYKNWQEELKRVEDKNKWMDDFLESLESL